MAYEELQIAVRTLATVCDYAHSQDGVGFNGTDTNFGHSLAKQANWTNKQAISAYKMLRKYKNQLASYGIDYDAIPEPKYVEPIQTKTVEIANIDGEDRFLIKTNPPLFNLNDQIKAIAGRRWNPDLNGWHVPITSADQLQPFIEKNRFTCESDVAALIESEIRAKELNYLASFADSADDFEVEINGTPRPYQLAGAKYLVEKERSWLADPTGLGKTLQVLMALKKVNGFPALIVCPKNALSVWKRQAAQWIGATSYQVSGRLKAEDADLIIDALKGGNNWIPIEAAPLLDSPNIVVCNYDILSSWLPVFEAYGFKVIIADECHKVKGPKTQRTKAVQQLCKNIKYRWFLSATPSMNRMYELWPQIVALGREKDFGGWKYFVNRHCGYADGWGDLTGSQNEDEFNRKARSICYIRREVEEVAGELPDVQRNVIYLDIDNRTEYQRALDDIIAFVGDEAASDREFNASIADLDEDEQEKRRNAYAASAEAKAERAEFLVRIAKLKKLAAQGKLSGIKDWIQEFIDRNEKLIVAGWHEDIIKELAAHFGYGYITGSVSQAKRDEIVDKFQTDDNYLLVFLNLRAGSESITLTGTQNNPCRNAANIELDWSPMYHKQFIGRIRRLGTSADFLVSHYLLADRTIDEVNYAMLNQKEVSVTTAITGGTDTIEEVGLVATLKEWLMKEGK